MNALTTRQAVLFLRARYLGPAGPDRTAETRQIDTQRQLCTEAARVLGAMVIGEYVEYGGTGAIDRRPRVQRLLDDLRTLGGIGYVIVSGLDRLARKRADLDTIELALDAAGTRLVIASGILTIRPSKEVQV